MGDVARLITSRSSAISLQQWVEFFTYAGHQYPLAGLNQTLQGVRQEIADGTFGGFVSTGYRGNSVVFACMLTRLSLFSEARFQFRTRRSGRPGELFGNESLRILERPWSGGTTGDLLTRMMVDADLAGNAYVARRGNRLRRLRPDWVTIVMGSMTDDEVDGSDIDADVLGYIYYPGGRNSGKKPETLLRQEVAHFAPIPDPFANYRGMSWLTPVVREYAADSAARDHKLAFFENGATPNMVVKLDKDVQLAAFQEWVTSFKESEPKGLDKAYKTLYLGAGADVTLVGNNLQQLDFKVTQGAGETRIAAAAGVPPVIVGLSEGLQGSSLNAGNYGMARRRFADLTMRPLWRNAAGSLEVIVQAPAGAELWYDDRDIPFLQEDVKDAAEIVQLHAVTVKSLVDSGFTPESVVAAVNAGDLSLLKHTGLYSVQLQPPMPDGPAEPTSQLGRALAALVAPHLQKEAH